jgi:RNA polymerase sigma-70 factor, ECF subfamily
VRLVRAGEAHAFDELVRRFLRGALAVALEYARDRDEAEDIVQETFIRTLRHLPRYNDQLAFRPWFFTILRNLGRNAAERRTRTAGTAIPENAAHHSPDTAAAAELRDIIDQELAGMTQQQSFSFRLYKMEGFSALEVADMLGIAPATVRTHVHRARLKLRKVLSRRGYGSHT